MRRAGEDVWREQAGEPLLKRCTAPPARRGAEEQQLEQALTNDKFGSSIPATVVNLLKNIVGAGLLNVCVAFKHASLLGGLVVMIFSSFVCTSGFLLLGYACSKTRAKTFRELFRYTVGDRYEKVVDITLFFHCFFSCVGYVTLIGDFATKVCSGLAPGSLFARRRDAPVCVIAVFVLFPLSRLRNLDKLKYTSAMGLAVTALACGYVFYDCVAGSEHDGVSTLRENYAYLRLDIFKAIALFNGSFSAHYNAPTYYTELRHRSFKRFAQATLWAFGIATALFTTFGIAGFARFGNQTMGNVLKSYSADNPMVQVSWLCMMVSTIFVFPHAFLRMRSSWTALVNKPKGLHAQSPIPVTTIALLAMCVYLGVAFDDIAVIKMIKGATLGVSVMFIFPGLVTLGLPPDAVGTGNRAQLLRTLSVLLIITGVVQGALALMVHYNIL